MWPRSMLKTNYFVIHLYYIQICLAKFPLIYSVLSVGVRIHWLPHLQRGESLPKKECVPGIKQNCIWWWGSSFRLHWVGQSIPTLWLRPDPFCHRGLMGVRFPSMSQIDVWKLLAFDEVERKTLSRNDNTKHVNMNIQGTQFPNILTCKKTFDRILKISRYIYIYIYIYMEVNNGVSSSSSSYRAGSTDIPDPLSPLLPIVYRPRQVFRSTSCIPT